MLVALLALDRAGGLDRAAVEKKLLGQGGLTRVGVGDDGEGAPSFDFGSEICHRCVYAPLFACCPLSPFFRGRKIFRCPSRERAKEYIISITL